MQIHNKKIERYTGDVVFTRRNGDDDLEEITLKVRSMRPGWRQDAYTLFPEPEPPRDPRGATKADPVTKQMVPVVLENDPGYIADLESHRLNILAYQIHSATLPGQIEWDTEPVPDSAPAAKRVAFYAAIAQELCDAFGEGELLQWQGVIAAIGQVGGADIALAERGFFRLASGVSGVPEKPETEAIGVHVGLPRDADAMGEWLDLAAVGGDAAKP